MSADKCTFNKIVQRSENIADVLLRHLAEEGGCNHKINAIVEEAFDSSSKSENHYHDNGNQSMGAS